ncbi:Crp/Fnr family transcriptional regulator [Fodinicola feengrottensis]|uniref:Cyclic nucleotide-binding domain-containing protein n=2 Tax=Fodinicola feengrottensis TaxID=435914 RepID=A0ABN2H0G2_9ACTN|nr:Crp/Fnr family transcriptional regulator [Fodinicola feengrottensis]
MLDGDQRRVTFLDRVPSHRRSDLVSRGRPARFASRQVLFQQGEPGNHVYLLRTGRVKVVRIEPDGRTTLLAVRVGGDLIGETSVLDGRDRSATVTALAPVTAHRFGADEFHRAMEECRLAPDLMRYVTGRLRESDELRAEMAVLPVRARLARTLIRLTNSCGSVRGDEVWIEVSQDDLAQAVGASRNMIVKELTHLRGEALVRTGRRLVVLRDLPRLHRIATDRA